ncbi:hypothetical protein EOM86_05770 [Candidatus Nomurabacteria bacterium]|nr:hypothetical protein [Candidatus Nomurabacteria bacterium]
MNQISKKGRVIFSKDDKYYEAIWESRSHYCEECGIYLGDDLRDSSGRIAQRWRFSHILPKGRYPKLRHHMMNMNLLCLIHHEQWENGDQKAMKIYEPNQILIEKMRNEIISAQ